jgi:hypothetical protein
MIIPSNIQFKTPDLINEYQEIHPRLQIVLEDMASWVVAHGHEFVITDLLSEELEDKKLKRVSSSHREGRAADLRVRNWPLEFRKKFEECFEKKYIKIAAISKATGLPNLVFIHDNGVGGIHTHISIRKGL